MKPYGTMLCLMTVRIFLTSLLEHATEKALKKNIFEESAVNRLNFPRKDSK